jgi:hypothetical protein
LVGFGGQLAALPDDEVLRLREGLAADLKAEPWTYLTTGKRVRILRGPLEGFQGVLLRRKGRFRFVLSLDLICRSIIADVDVSDVAPVTRLGSSIAADGLVAPISSLQEISNHRARPGKAAAMNLGDRYGLGQSASDAERSWPI